MLIPEINEYPAPLYSVLWFYKNHAKGRITYYREEGIIPIGWYQGSKAMALFIDKLNQYYLDSQNKANPLLPIN